MHLEAALELAELRRLQLAGAAGRADLAADLQVLRDCAVRLLAAGRLRALDQPGAVQHPHVKVQVAGIDREPRRELAVRQRLVRLAECLQHLQAQRMAERLQLLGPVELEDVGRARLGLRRRSSPVQLIPCGAVEEDLEARRQPGKAGGHVRA